MAVSAIYGVARYGQSRYGRLLIEGSSNLTFGGEGSIHTPALIKGSSELGFSGSGRVIAFANAFASETVSFQSNASVSATGSIFGGTPLELSSSSRVIGVVRGGGSAGLLFSSVSSPTGLFPAKGSSSLIFSSLASINPMVKGGTGLLFTTYADLTAPPSPIYGSANLLFVTDTILIATGESSGESPLLFSTDGKLLGNAESRGQTGLEFFPKWALTNAARVYSIDSVEFSTGAKIIYQNKGPSYQNFDGSYVDLNFETNPSVGYLGLLLDRTSGETPLPYEETME